MGPKQSKKNKNSCILISQQNREKVAYVYARHFLTVKNKTKGRAHQKIAVIHSSEALHSPSFDASSIIHQLSSHLCWCWCERTERACSIQSPPPTVVLCRRVYSPTYPHISLRLWGLSFRPFSVTSTFNGTQTTERLTPKRRCGRWEQDVL